MEAEHSIAERIIVILTTRELAKLPVSIST
jgi:hypothetical protein